MEEKMNETANQTKQDLKRLRRCSYLLRLWRTDNPGGSNWQASLEAPGNGERIGFASLEELFGYLMDLTTSAESLKGEPK